VVDFGQPASEATFASLVEVLEQGGKREVPLSAIAR